MLSASRSMSQVMSAVGLQRRYRYFGTEVQWPLMTVVIGGILLTAMTLFVFSMLYY